MRLGSCNKQYIFSFLPRFPQFCQLLELSRQPCSCPLASTTLEMPPIGCLPGLLGVISTSATKSLLVQVGLPLISWVHLVLNFISPRLPHCMAVHFFHIKPRQMFAGMETDVLLEFEPCLHLPLCWKARDHVQFLRQLSCLLREKQKKTATVLCP